MKRFQIFVITVALLGLGVPAWAQNDQLDLDELLGILTRDQEEQQQDPAPVIEDEEPLIRDEDTVMPEVPLPEQPVEEEDIDIDDLRDLLGDPIALPEESAEADEPVVREEPVQPRLDPEITADEDMLAQMERARLQAAEEDGMRSMRLARSEVERGRYREAIQAYLEALRLIPVRPATAEIHPQLRRELANAYLIQAGRQSERSEFLDARQSLSEAEAHFPQHPELAAMRAAIDRRERLDRIIEERRDPERERLEEKEESIERLIARGIGFFDDGYYNEAERQFELVLIQDPYNRDAMRYLKRIEDRRFAASTQMRRATKAGMIADVRDTWNPPVRATLLDPADLQPGPPVVTRPDTQVLRDKLNTIIIPSINVRQAHIVDVINFLREASEAQDPDGIGVNIILRVDPTGQRAPAVPDEQFQRDFDDDIWGPTGAVSPPRGEMPIDVSDIPTITLNLRRVTLLDAIKYVTEVAGLRYRLDGNVVIITPRDALVDPVITRLYPVQPSVIDMVIQRQGTTTTGGAGTGFFPVEQQPQMERGDVKEFFTNAGVPFPEGTSITYNAAISQLIVSNTAENLENFERILMALNILPNQVEIEARFVEVQQNDLEALGFEWLLDDNWEIAVRDGPGSPMGRQRIVMDGNRQRGGFSRGMRYFDGDTAGSMTNPGSGPLYGAGGILGISSILTNPEVSMVLHAINQRGGVDLLSAPRVTTRSGVNAQIMVVREIQYPTDFTADVTTIQGGLAPDIAAVVVTPTGFETRETGVILNVTPTVGPDGYTIDLAMVPEVSELVEWIQYGVTLPDGGGYNMPKPVFSSRNVTTSIVIWDGQTVVMGGLIREEVVDIDDKIPLLGDIPIIGRLFRSKGTYSAKQNLLIFVTARLVDPAGNPINRPGMDHLEHRGRSSRR